MTSTSETAAAVEVPMVNATIDGIAVSVPKGTLIIRAAEDLGIQIPRFCDHPLLDPVGACRQCLVEVAMPGRDGEVRAMPKPQPSCAMELSEGMQVKTQGTSEMAEKAQHGVMEFLLINHPLDCPVCDKGGECPLQNQAMSNGRATSRFVDVKRTFPKPIHISTQVLLDRERCILCQRCTRFSDQIAGDPFIDLQKRGASQQVGTFSPSVLGIHTEGAAMETESGEPFASYFSGNTIQICPVGALTSAAYRFRSRPFDLVSTPSVCSHCSSGCAIRIDHRRGAVLRQMAGMDMDVNEEWLCDKGRFAFRWPTLNDRIEGPMVRDRETGELRAASWPEALAEAARGLTGAQAGDGEAFGREEVIPSGTGVLIGGRHTVEDAYAYAKFARVVLGTNNIDFRNRAHTAEEQHFLGRHVVGRSVADSVTFADLERARNVLLIGFEPEEESASVFLRLRKAVRKHGTRVFTIAPFASRGVAKLDGTVIQAAPGTEAEVVDALSVGHQELAAEVEVLQDGATVVLIGERAAEVKGLLTSVMKLTQSLGADFAWIPRRAGERAAIDAGCLPGLLPGGRPVDTDQARHEMATIWGVGPLPGEPGLDASGIAASAAAGNLPGLLVAGVDVRDADDPHQLVAALDAAAFVVALDVRHTDVTRRADVVLPVAPPAEKNGTYLNWEGRPRALQRALSTNAMSDVRVLASLADYLDMPAEFGLTDVADAAAEWAGLPRSTSAVMAGPKAASQPPSPPVRGRAVVASWHQLLDAGLTQDGEPHLAGTAHRAVARMSAETAQETGVATGQLVELAGKRGTVEVPVVITDMPDGVVWAPATCNGTTLREVGIFAGGMVSVQAATSAAQVAGSSEGKEQTA